MIEIEIVVLLEIESLSETSICQPEVAESNALKYHVDVDLHGVWQLATVWAARS